MMSLPTFVLSPQSSLGVSRRTLSLLATLLVSLGVACEPEEWDRGGEGEGEGEAEGGDFPGDTPYDVVVDVDVAGPYGVHTFVVPAKTNWVNTGLFLRVGETAHIEATGQWMVEGVVVPPDGDSALGIERECPRGALVARSGLRFEGSIQCIGAEGTLTADANDVVYVGMVTGTDLGETYETRLVLDGELVVTVSSSGDTVPSVRRDAIATFPLSQVNSGVVELISAHHIVTIEAAEVMADLDVAAASLDVLDEIWEVERVMRGRAPFLEQRIRWFPDPSIESLGYMLAGNPVRCVPDLMNGFTTQRILRASEPATDIWGFAHELGHVFSMAGGTWVYQYNNLESWPNIFTLRVLRTLERTAFQPNIDTYCDGREAYLAGGAYETLRNDPFVQLCFLMEFEEEYGESFYDSFFQGLDSQTNDDVGWDGTDAATWRYVRDRFNVAAGEDTTHRFDAWRVPLR